MNQWAKRWLFGWRRRTDWWCHRKYFVSLQQPIKIFHDYILKDKKKKTPTKQISKPGSSWSPLPIRFPPQETIAERIKLNPRKRKTTRTRLKFYL